MDWLVSIVRSVIAVSALARQTEWFCELVGRRPGVVPKNRHQDSETWWMLVHMINHSTICQFADLENVLIQNVLCVFLALASTPSRLYELSRGSSIWGKVG